MKKILTILFFTFCSFVVNAQQTTVDTTTISNAERIIDKYSGKIANTFIAGIEKITPVAINGFEVVVKLQIAEGLFNLLFVFINIVLFWLFFKEYNRIQKLLRSGNYPRSMNESYGPFDESNATAKLWIFAVLSCFFVLFSPFCLYDACTHLIAPEWFAIKEIIELFK